MGMQKVDVFGGLEDFSPEQLKQVDGIIASHKGKPGALIPVLEQVQEVLGYLPVAVQMLVAFSLQALSTQHRSSANAQTT